MAAAGATEVPQMDNPTNRLQARFAAGGMQAIHPGGNLELRLESYGYGERRLPVAVPVVKTESGRVRLERGPLTEWYVNDSEGLEQGFTLAARPGQSAGDPLVLDLSVSGDLTPVLMGDAVVLCRGQVPVLRYTGLHAWDAGNRALITWLEVSGGHIRLMVDDAAATYPVTVDPWLQQQKLVAFDAAANDLYAGAVAISGDTLVVGASGKTNGTGAAYIYVRGGTNWNLQQKITASDAAAGDHFGSAVSISGDTVVVTSPQKGGGAAYVFTRSGTVWSQQQKLVANDAAAGDNFGQSVSVNVDTVAIGSRNTAGTVANTGGAYIYVRSGATWSQQQKIFGSDGAANDQFGDSLSLSGNTLAVGASRKSTYAGQVYVFTRSGATWSFQQSLTEPSAGINHYFGLATGLSVDTLVVGAQGGGSGGTGAAFAFVRNGTTWTLQQALTSPDLVFNDKFGAAVSVQGDAALVGATLKGFNRGAAFFFSRTGTTWTLQTGVAALDATGNDMFGSSVAIDGQNAVVGAPGITGFTFNGYAYTYQIGYRYNTGGTIFNDLTGRLWYPDPALPSTFTFYTQNPVKNTDKSYLYQSERFSIGTAMQYSFTGLNAPSYVVRLMFAETYFTSPGQRKFHININGTQVATDFDILATAGASNTAVDQLFNVTPSAGTITVQLLPSLSNPKISGIEIFPAGPSVAVAPGISPHLAPGQTQQFTATIAGTGNTGVTWSISPQIGSISPTGLYTAPANVTNPGKVIVTAASQADPTRTATAIVQLIATPWAVPPGSSISNNSITVSGTGDINFTNDTFTFLYTTLTGNGSITARVNQPYTTPNVYKSGVMMRKDASSSAPHTFMSLFSAIVSLIESRTFPAGGTNVQFGAAGVFWMRLVRQDTAFLGYVSNDATNWISVGSPQSSVTNATTLTGLAVSNGLAVQPNVVTFDNVDINTTITSIAINETLASLAPGQQAQFSATVLNPTGLGGVTWSISPPGAGTIGTTLGTYRAPAVISYPGVQAVTITATSTDDPTVSASTVIFIGGFQPVHVNCGGPSHYDPTGKFWNGDTNVLAGLGNLYSSGAPIANTQTPYLYQSEHFITASTLYYKFFVPNGTYNLTLKFAEIFFTASGKRVMNILVNGLPVESNFDIYAAAGANTAIDKTYPINVTGGEILIYFQPAQPTHAPKINAIQIE